jgi:hypothetical protein
MKTKLICSLLILTLAAACGRSSAGRDQQQQYETVSEGSASGVTSTIHGPGETLPPITGTNADHTTAFAFDPNAPPSTSSTMPSTMTTNTQPLGTMAGTMPPPVTRTTPPPVTAPRPQPVPQEPPPQQPRPVTPQPTPPPPTDTQPPQPPPPTDTTETEPPEPPPTDTGEQEPEPEPPPPPTNTDTSTTSTPPPPPPM